MIARYNELLLLLIPVLLILRVVVIRNGSLAMPEVSEVKTMAEDVVDLTVRAAEEPAVEQAETVELQQLISTAEEQAAAEMTMPKAEEKVGEAPKFVVKPEPKAVNEGQTVVFECELSGEPIPEVQ